MQVQIPPIDIPLLSSLDKKINQINNLYKWNLICLKIIESSADSDFKTLNKLEIRKNLIDLKGKLLRLNSTLNLEDHEYKAAISSIDALLSSEIFKSLPKTSQSTIKLHNISRFRFAEEQKKEIKSKLTNKQIDKGLQKTYHEAIKNLEKSFEFITFMRSLQLDSSRNKEMTIFFSSLNKMISKMPEHPDIDENTALWILEVNRVSYEIELFYQSVLAYLSKEKIEQWEENVGSQLDIFGNKHKNLIKIAYLSDILAIPDIHVPVPKGLSSSHIHSFLIKVCPEVFKYRNELKKIYQDNPKEFWDHPQVKKLLALIDETLAKAFSETEIVDILENLPEMAKWLEELKERKAYLMVRSTGAEDSDKFANAGGNVSVPYVRPEGTPVCQAISEVVRSYFSFNSLKNQTDAGINPFDQDPHLAVTLQELVGEEIEGTENISQIPVSVVLFSNEPLFVGNEIFRVMRISATYGHGEGVVGNQGINTDTVLVVSSDSNPNKIFIYYDNRAKNERLAPGEEDGTIVLKKLNNPPTLVQNPALSQAMIKKLYCWGILAENFYDNKPTDMELVIKAHKIYPVQARPVNRPSLQPTYVDVKKIEESSSSLEEKTYLQPIVSGKSSVTPISHPNEILLADTLEIALALFDSHLHRCVIVFKEEPENSHPVVNFSGLGIPCFYSSDNRKNLELQLSKHREHLILLCSQSSILYFLKTPLQAGAFTSTGFTTHPAKINASLFLHPLIQPQIPPVESDLEKLIVSLREAPSQEKTLQILKEINNHPLIRDYKERLQRLTVEEMTPNMQEILKGMKELQKKLRKQLKNLQ